MSEITWAHTSRDDGQPYRCFETFAVYDGRERVGFFQCKGPCRGFNREAGHRHGPWMAFVGKSSETATDLPGWYETQGAAADAVAIGVRDQSAATAPEAA